MVDLPHPGGPFNKINRAIQPVYESTPGGKATKSETALFCREASAVVPNPRDLSVACGGSGGCVTAVGDAAAKGLGLQQPQSWQLNTFRKQPTPAALNNRVDE